MEDSATYRAIVRQGRTEEARRIILLIGETKFGPANDATRASLDSIRELEWLEELGAQLMNAETWSELLPTESSEIGRDCPGTALTASDLIARGSNDALDAETDLNPNHAIRDCAIAGL